MDNIPRRGVIHRGKPNSNGQAMQYKWSSYAV